MTFLLMMRLRPVIMLFPLVAISIKPIFALAFRWFCVVPWPAAPTIALVLTGAFALGHGQNV